MRVSVKLGCFALALATLGCGSTASRWWSDPKPTLAEAEILIETTRSVDFSSDALVAREIPDIPVRAKLRPCCAFGSDLGASIAGVIPIPGYRIPNVIGPDDVGPHTFDSGLVSLALDGTVDPAFDRERNGLVYTCHGGFIDTAHVRDYADWAIFLVAQIARLADTGGVIELPPEGGSRRVVVKPLPRRVVAKYSLRSVAAGLAQWMAFQLSIWHEIATWYGYASVRGFSERASAFSPEDLYSNAIGAKLMLAVVYGRDARDEFGYNRGIDVWFAQVLKLLGAQPSSLGQQVSVALDGLWWDSRKLVPDPRLLQRRNFAIGSPIQPWLPPDSALAPELRAELDEACGGERRAISLENPPVRAGLRLADSITLEIEVDEQIAKHEPFATRGRKLTQADFPEIVGIVREQALVEFGPRADQPD
jgi:hypothetical protein